jgi:imidazolonepropionase-like amidohydrolase
MTGRILIRNARVWDGEADGLADGGEVLIEGGRILEVGRIRTDREAETIDLGGRFLMPGLIDAHFHAYWGPPSVPHLETLPLSYLAHHAARLLSATLRRGFTTIRDAGGADWGLWRALEDGLIEGPRLYYAGRALSQTGGHGDSREQHIEPCSCRFIANLSETADGVDEVRKAARETLRRGAHHLKIFLSGGVVSPTDPIWMRQYSDAEVRAAVEEAASRRTYVMAHAYTAEAATRAALNGVRSVEHGNLIDEVAARHMAEAGTFLVPTLVTYDVLSRDGPAMGLSADSRLKLESVAARGTDAIRLARAAGVEIGFGTDLAGPAHAFQRDEFRLRAATDSPINVLRSATSVNARMMGLEGTIGSIRPGAHADIVAIDGDPREDISALFPSVGDLKFVMKAGRIAPGHLS